MTDYIDNLEAETIASELIPQFHPHLVGLKIAHLSKVKPPKKKQGRPPREGKKMTMAKAARVSPKMRALGANFHFVIEYDDAIWQELTEDKKRALVDHELLHCGNDADGVYLRAHQVEEFGIVLERHGLWRCDVEQFAESVEKAMHV